MARAKTSLPQPLSPRISTVALDRATHSAMAINCRMELLAMMAFIPRNTCVKSELMSNLYFASISTIEPSAEYPRRTRKSPPRLGHFVAKLPETKCQLVPSPHGESPQLVDSKSLQPALATV